MQSLDQKQPAVGILGGTFDPIHYGHLRTALEVAEHFGITDMRLIVGKVPPHRPQPVATAEQRFDMLQLAVANEPSLRADDREIRRDGYSYTVDTLQALRAEVGDKTPLLFSLGVDAFLYFQQWHRWETILSLAHLVVVHRTGYSLPPAAWYASRLSTERGDLYATPAGRIYCLAVTPLAISATRLRDILQQGQNPRYLLPDSVLDYIQTHQLYVRFNGTGTT